jgi:hypothetical protein
LLRRVGHDDMHIESLSLQCANKFRSFVSRDSAGDAYGDLHVKIVRWFDLRTLDEPLRKTGSARWISSSY